MTSYEPVIGIEVHVELNTKTKMFCRCSADYFGKEPNTHTCPVCLGLPGALPYTNEEALKKCMQIGLALNCTVLEKSLFERKNYFYPDLPKGYQISQYRWPLCIEGWVEIEGGKKIRVNRVHQEEDTGKLTHVEGETLIDFNRSGVPLVEIVTEPDFKTSEEVRDYAKKLQQIFKNLGVSNADMERGDMRLEANISVRLVGQQNLPLYRVEVKNINSFKYLVSAIEHEISRQIGELDKGEKLLSEVRSWDENKRETITAGFKINKTQTYSTIEAEFVYKNSDKNEILPQETRGWDQIKKETKTQRSKEEAHDYRYFPEPDLPELKLKHLEAEIKEQIKGKLPEERADYLVKTFGISGSSGATLVTQGMAQYFEEAAKMGQQEGIDPRGTANYIINRKIDPATTPQQIINDMKAKSSGVISDTGELEKVVKDAVRENPKIVESYKKGKLASIQALVGAVMKKTQGKADPTKVKEILEKHLS